MSSRRGSSDDYPEHLNPFYEGNEKPRFWKLGKVKRSGSFGESLRNSFIFKSFRGRKKDKQQAPCSPPELRKNVSSTETRNRQTLPPPRLSPIYSPTRSSVQIPLPRSRFSERVAKSSEAGLEDEMVNEHITTRPPNGSVTTVDPFDDGDKVAALKLRRIRRRKKRAPLPPNVTREEGDAAYLGVSSMHNLSKWSLTSVETDISTYSENESLAAEGVNHEISEIMNNITKEMEKLTDETNDSPIQTKEASEEKPLSDIPDLIVSSTETTRNEEFRDTDEEVPVSDITENKSDEAPIDENSNIVSKTKSDNNETKLKDVDSCNNKIITSCDDVSSSELECNNNTNHTSSEQDLNFNERKSIYITDSNEQLDKSDSVKDITNISEVTKSENGISNNNSPPVSPRCRTEVTVILNSSDNIIEDEKDSKPNHETASETTVNSPTPKRRTHKLSKSDLLGNNTTISA